MSVVARRGAGRAGARARVHKQAEFALFASGFLNRRYRLFFNNTEEVKQILPGGQDERRKPVVRREGRDGLDCIEPVVPGRWEPRVAQTPVT